MLLVDCDPQGNLSSDLDWYPISEDGTILPQLAHVLDREPIPLKDVAKNTVYPGLDIIPNSVIISPKEHEINSYMYREELLKRYFKRKENEELTATYDYVIFDNPPSANILVVNSLIASDFYLIPIQATRKALEGTFSFQSIIARIQEEKNIFEIGKVLTFWDNNRNEPKKVEKDLNEKLGGYVFKTKVRNLAEISSEQMPKVLSNKKDSEAKKDMTNFCEEFEERLTILIQSK